ncbi:hypothetical protein [Flavobacterium kingsejongi]|uniref:Uncharacterized protein n=1 Tax=Flavobacterium kingsejongi TaxID=1678728 RepID=A0A2S1LLX3_9FLAO|nr:hypothetical protein [Flavobacterium kingsejongi]AWG24752.1 hypothetical protein FK004_05670 [Flavobacterium kingsejongi]
MGKFYNWMILVVLLAIIGSCQNDDVTTENPVAKPGQEIPAHYRMIHWEDLEDHPKLLQKLKELQLLPAAKNKPTKERAATSGYGIATPNFLWIEKGSYHSVTFPLYREENNGFLENLLLSLQSDGSYKVYLLQYEMTEAAQLEYANGKAFDFKRPLTITVLNGWESKAAAFSAKAIDDGGCNTWSESITPGSMCASNEHTWQNITDGQTCVHYGTPGMPTPDIVQLVFKFCNEGGGSSNGGSASGSSGSSSGGNSGSSGNPGQGGGPPKPTDPNAPITPGIEDGNGNPWTSPLPTLPPLRRFTLSLTPEQKSWWQNAPAALQQLFSNFLESDNFDTAAEFAREALDALMEGGDVDFTYKVIIDKSFKDNECLMGVFTQLGGAPTFQNYLRNFDSDFSVAHLKLSADSNFFVNYPQYPSSGAITFGTYNYVIEIIMNIDPNLESSLINYPKIYTALALIHELIHAEIYRKLSSVEGLADFNPNNYTPEQWNTFLKNLMPNFPGLFDYYTRYKNSNSTPTSPQHEQMAQHYRDIIKQTLKNYDNNTHEDNFYEALSWVGLEGTVAWNNLTTNEQSNIKSKQTNIINNESYCND